MIQNYVYIIIVIAIIGYAVACYRARAREDRIFAELKETIQDKWLEQQGLNPLDPEAELSSEEILKNWVCAENADKSTNEMEEITKYMNRFGDLNLEIFDNTIKTAEMAAATAEKGLRESVKAAEMSAKDADKKRNGWLEQQRLKRLESVKPTNERVKGVLNPLFKTM